MRSGLGLCVENLETIVWVSGVIVSGIVFGSPCATRKMDFKYIAIETISLFLHLQTTTTNWEMY